MIILGAGGHARELLDIIKLIDSGKHYFFDDTINDLPKFINGISVIRQIEVALRLLQDGHEIVLGVGGVNSRKNLYRKFLEHGITAKSIIAPSCIISDCNVIIEDGVNIMHHVLISNNVCVGKNALINSKVNLHHDVMVGDFCEIAPGATLLGGVNVAKNTFIGAGAVLLPNVQIGPNCIIGAGAVVLNDLAPGTLTVGVPAKQKNKRNL